MRSKMENLKDFILIFYAGIIKLCQSGEKATRKKEQSFFFQCNDFFVRGSPIEALRR